MSKENTTNTFIACGTWLKTPFYTSSAGVELPLGTQRIPHPLSLLFKSGAYLCGQMCLHKLVSTLSKELNLISRNDGEPKYDIRQWAPDHAKMGKGISLSREEAEELKTLLIKWLPR